DGIRDFHVTGVQTCALPILEHVRELMTSTTVTGLADLPFFFQRMPQNRKKNGRSARPVTVVDVISSRTCSSSRIWEMKVPVERENGRAAWRGGVRMSRGGQA